MAGEEEKTKGPAPAVSPFRFVGWLFSALSILELVDQLNAVHIYGLLKNWTAAYSSFVVNVKTFLFGWIHFGWMSIDKPEAHVLVICSVFAAAFFRAEFRRQRVEKDEHRSDAFAAAIGLAAGCFLFAFVPALVLPGAFGFYGAAAGLLLVILVAFSRRTAEDNLPGPKAIAVETAGSLAIFLVLLAANYAFFR
jgi:hypothetical protein